MNFLYAPYMLSASGGWFKKETTYETDIIFYCDFSMSTFLLYCLMNCFVKHQLSV